MLLAVPNSLPTADEDVNNIEHLQLSSYGYLDSYGYYVCYWLLPVGLDKLLLALANTVILVPSPAELMTIFYCLTTLGVMQLTDPGLGCCDCYCC
jgi:hypothetical protein